MSALTAVSQVSSMTQTGSEQQNNEQTLPEPPRASDQSLEFLQLLDIDDYKNLMFTDSLVTVSDTGKEIGEFGVTISPAKRNGQECILVHANSHGTIDNVPCGTSITAYVSFNLETLEQQHHEYVKLENHPLDRKTFFVKQNDDFVISRVIAQGKDIQRSSHTFKLDMMQGFISEGSNLVLQRLLVKKGVKDSLQLLSFDSDSNLCPAIYKPLDDRTQVIQETQIDVTGFERTINSEKDLPTTWQSYFTKDGHLTSRVQIGSPVAMRLVVLPEQPEEEEEPEKPTFSKKMLNWEEDVQLYSKFLDRKEELKGDHAVYMRHHPELKALLADFLQFLLLRKPDDVLAFAAEYFSSFSTNIPNTSAYKQSSTPTQFPNSRASPKIQHLAQSR